MSRAGSRKPRCYSDSEISARLLPSSVLFMRQCMNDRELESVALGTLGRTWLDRLEMATVARTGEASTEFEREYFDELERFEFSPPARYAFGEQEWWKKFRASLLARATKKKRRKRV